MRGSWEGKGLDRRFAAGMIQLIAAAAVPAAATIVDSGDVALLAGNHLVIGNTAGGSRTVDSMSDGSYDLVSLGVASGTTGALTLDHDASFTTTGLFAAGVLGEAVVQLHDGSVLTTGGALLGMAQVTLDGGSSWVNHAQLTLSGGSSFRVLDGSTASDAGVVLSAVGGLRTITVDGAGSTWHTGDFSVVSGLGAGPEVSITNGGSVFSSSALLGEINTTPALYSLSGVGSLWSIDGTLESRADSMGVTIADGARLESGNAHFSTSGNFNGFGISGTGSTWDVRGDLDVEASQFFAAQMTGGGTLLVEGDVRLTAQFDNRIEVDGTGSLFRAGGSLVIDPFGVNDPDPFEQRGVLRVANGGRAEIALGVTMLDDSRIELDGGTLQTTTVTLNDAILTGAGTIDGNVLNSGRVAPDAIEVTGSYVQTSDGTFVVTLGGTQAGIDYSLLDVLGTSVLAGDLEVQLADGYAPALGDVYEVLRAAALSGAFENLTGLDLGNGLSLQPEYRPDGFALYVIPEPGTAVLVIGGLLGLAIRKRRLA